MAGYSATPLSKKLGIKPGHRVAALNAPRTADATIAEMAAEAPILPRLTGKSPFNVIILFCFTGKDLKNSFPKAASALAIDGGLWIAWPKKTSGLQSDLDENDVREFGLAAGLVDNKVCAIDETWSGLRFVVRLVDRSANTPSHPRIPRPGR